MAALKARPFLFFLSDTVVREVRKNIERKISDALDEAEIAIGKVLSTLDVTAPAKDELIGAVSSVRMSLTLMLSQQISAALTISKLPSASKFLLA